MKKRIVVEVAPPKKSGVDSTCIVKKIYKEFCIRTKGKIK